MTSTPEPRYQVGDPDPTPNPSGDCPAMDPDDYMCTWPAGHVGDHVAGDLNDQIAAVWPNEDGGPTP